MSFASYRNGKSKSLCLKEKCQYIEIAAPNPAKSLLEIHRQLWQKNRTPNFIFLLRSNFGLGYSKIHNLLNNFIDLCQYFMDPKH